MNDLLKQSPTKDFLADEDNYSDDTKAGLAHHDPKIRKIIGGMILRNRMFCNDGFHMSVQYSRGHYCNARSRFMGGDLDNDDDPIPEPRTVEVGFPNKREPGLLGPYAEDVKRLTKTVYAFVPIEVVDAVIEKHDGLKPKALPST